jgi:hypothetical protein
MMSRPSPTPPSSARVKRHCGPSGIFVFAFVVALFGTFSLGQALNTDDPRSQQLVWVGLSIEKELDALSNDPRSPQWVELVSKTIEQLYEQRGRDLDRLDTNKSRIQSLATGHQALNIKIAQLIAQRTEKVDDLSDECLESLSTLLQAAEDLHSLVKDFHATIDAAQEQRGGDFYFMDTDKSTMLSSVTREQALEIVVAKMKDQVDNLNDQCFRRYAELFFAFGYLNNLHVSAGIDRANFDIARDRNRELEMQIALTNYILGRDKKQKLFGKPSLPLDKIQRVMELESYADIDALTREETLGCIRILHNFGLESNPFFRMLWTDKTGKELHDWQSKHRDVPHIATGDADEDVMKVRLADYLGIGLPSDAAADVGDGDEDEDGNTVDATDEGTKCISNGAFRAGWNVARRPASCKQPKRNGARLPPSYSVGQLI